MNRCSLGLGALRPDQLRAAFAFGKDFFLRTSKADEKWEGSGIVICGGGRYLQWALANVKNCRRFTGLPIQVWSLNSREIPDVKVFEALGAEVVNVQDRLGAFPQRKFGGWHLKHFAAFHCPFRRVLVLDADSMATKAGIELLDHEALRQGAILFQDVKRCHVLDLGYFSASVQPPRFLNPKQEEFESGQMVFDKGVCHAAIRMTCWLNEHSDAWWKGMHGDKASLELAFRGMKAPHALGQAVWKDWGIEHSFDGKWVFAHCLGVKRGKAGMPKLE